MMPEETQRAPVVLVIRTVLIQLRKTR